MWKYIGKNEYKEFLLSLNLFKCEEKDKYLKTLYSISNNVENNYDVYKIKKRNGKFRTIHNPNKLLKTIQKNILSNILNNKKISKYARAYHRKISLKDNAKEHVNKKIVLKLDIKDFFESISFLDIYNSAFPIEYFPKPVGILLTYLCTYYDYLPQGAPTSAYISNLVMKDFDEKIGYFCDSNNISYTRYSDDMTFSGDFNPGIIISRVRKMLRKLNLELNDNKTCIITNSQKQSVTGIVVNEKMQVSVEYRKKIRQEIYYIKKYGITSHLEFRNIKVEKVEYIKKLYGKILYVLQINNEDKEFLKYKKFIENYQN